ncbi:hypothetical protein JOD54_006748 [Actinokineospora baliensis]|nr:hypothetical protein [Actinokineospora baliensis]
MSANGFDPSRVQHDDPVGRTDGGHALRDDD